MTQAIISEPTFPPWKCINRKQQTLRCLQHLISTSPVGKGETGKTLAQRDRSGYRDILDFRIAEKGKVQHRSISLHSDREVFLFPIRTNKSRIVTSASQKKKKLEDQNATRHFDSDVPLFAIRNSRLFGGTGPRTGASTNTKHSPAVEKGHRIRVVHRLREKHRRLRNFCCGLFRYLRGMLPCLETCTALRQRMNQLR